MSTKLAKPPPPAPIDAKKVLVIRFGGLKAFIQALAAARLIREYHVGARITLLTSEEYKPLAENCPYYDVVELAPISNEPQAVAHLIRKIRKAKYDMVYDLECSQRSNALFLGLKPWPPRWSGIAKHCSHPHANPAREDLAPLDRFADQLHYAGVGPPEGWAPGAAPLPDLSWVRMAMRDPPRLQPGFYSLKQPYVLLIPGVDEDRPEQPWPIARYSELAQALARRGLMVAVLGGSAEREVGSAINRAEPKAKNLASRTDLFQLAALAERAAAAIGDDSGPMHVAAAAGAPCVVLYSDGRDPDLAAPRGRGGVLKLLAPALADLPVEDVVRAIGNLGALPASVAA
jgi:ADP-heptose:LPS heptosyltransferase